MDVSCPDCQTTFAEWARCCPVCAAPVEVAHYVIPARSHRRSRLIVLAVALVSLMTGLGLLTSTLGHHGVRPDVDQPRYGYGLASESLFLGGKSPEIVHADGFVLRRFPRAEVAGYPDLPVGGTGGAAAFMSPDGHAMLVGARSGRIIDVGPAVAVIPAASGKIGVQQKVTHRTTVLRYVAAGSLVPTGFSSPVWSQDVYQTGDALVANTGSDISVSIGRRSVALGQVDVIGAGGELLAWTRTCGPSIAGCHLHWLNVVDGRSQDVPPPAGTEGFAQGGAVGVGGDTIAAFVYPDRDAAHLRLALVDVRTGAVAVVGPDLAVGAPIGSATWSLDGHWLYFSGSAGSLRAQRVVDSSPVGRSVTLPLAATYSLAGL